jgi:beta-glucanase (GH16 family)
MLLCAFPLALSAAETPLLWADFKEPLQTHSGAPVLPLALSERPGDAVANSLKVIDSAVVVGGRVSHANGSQWATLGIEVGGDARGAPVNLSGQENIRIRLSASTPRVLRIRLKGQDLSILNSGCYPVMMQNVSTQATDYVIPLSAFGPEPYCGERGATVQQTLPAVTKVEITANEPAAEPVRFAVGRVEFLGALAAAARPAPAATAPRVARDARWALAWSDEFAAPSGRGIDASKWAAVRAPQPSTAGVRALYADSAKEASHDGEGHLVLRARELTDAAPRCPNGPCTHASARLHAKAPGAMLYGRMEVRFKAPRTAGLSTTLTLLGAPLADLPWPDAGEIVLYEDHGQPANATLGLHGPGLDDNTQRTRIPPIATDASAEGFHVAAVEWEPSSIRWFIDDVPVKTLPRSELTDRTATAFEPWPFLLHMGLSVGADGAGAVPERLPDDAQLLVDHVRLYQRNDLLAASRVRMASWQAQQRTAVVTASAKSTVNEAAKDSSRRRAVADTPASQPVRQVTCERNPRYGLMMCY